MKTSILFFMLVMALGANSQVVNFTTDELQRGYIDRPYSRYEAEPNKCVSNVEFLLPPEKYSQQPLQAEASNLTAISLVSAEDYVEWTAENNGRGLTLRFSLPDSQDGQGIKGGFNLIVNGVKRQEIQVDSYWAWQYTTIANTSEKYPDNTPSDDKFARMRFDEVYVLLDETIKTGDKIKFTKADDNELAYTVDFIELEDVPEPVKFTDITDSNKVEYDFSTPFAQFVSANGGKTIFIPEGWVNVSRPVNITTPGTKIIGAGMWYTTVYFSASSDDRSTYSSRGFHCSVDDCSLMGLTINTKNNKRYYKNNSAYQVGKGLNGSWGSNGYIKDVRIDHFECGGWITGAKNLTVEYCRFRNNYADGINLANNSSNCKVSHCSFRNNGDDDMASWSTGNFATNNEYSYNTAENNWRASSLGFFGGKNQRAHHIAIFDAMEAGARVNCDFDGTGFADEGQIYLSDISIYRCGSPSGTPGTVGGFWGSADASVELNTGWAYDLKNVRVENIDIYNSRHDAVGINANSGKKVINLELHNINIHGVDNYRYGVYIGTSVVGNGHYSNIKGEDVVEPIISTIPSGFDFVDISDSGVEDVTCDICDDVFFYDLYGRQIDVAQATKGIYIRRMGKIIEKVVLRH